MRGICRQCEEETGGSVAQKLAEGASREVEVLSVSESSWVSVAVS